MRLVTERSSIKTHLGRAVIHAGLGVTPDSLIAADKTDIRPFAMRDAMSPTAKILDNALANPCFHKDLPAILH